MENKDNQYLQLIRDAIEDKKGLRIAVLNVQNVSNITEYLVIAEGNIERHVTAIAQEVLAVMKKSHQMLPHHVEGLQSGEWVLIDFGNIVVHILHPDLRVKYQIDDLVKTAKKVEGF